MPRRSPEAKERARHGRLATYYTLRSVGVCTQCMRADAAPGRCHCAPCAEAARIRARALYHRKRDASLLRGAP